MAREASHLLSSMLLVLLASGSWAQDMKFEILKEEGETLFVSCWYSKYQSTMVKAWCRTTSVDSCNILVSSDQTVDPRCSIRVDPSYYRFMVTMTRLREQDSGTYYCGIYKDRQINILKTVHLVVSKAPAPRTTRSTQRTMMVTASASATSPATDSAPGDWKWKGIVVGVVVVVVVILLLGLSVLTALYLRKPGGRARKGKKDSHHIYEDLPAQKEATDFSQPAVSDQVLGTIHYASLIHLNHSGTKDPTDSNSALPSVEYANIAGHRPQPSVPPTLDGEPQN
ncbi:PREDICTED: trem-like transcript 4 protein isoform X2 [Chinchilla lanigera]|uniref:Trem-like transcript 4 protein n=1 Tax=Chinchilla lanigera TaxID=34839 RepID=A0A8C2VKG7_CHILA|nr:PREDICTED: trem-like transcript 4 protein isoform X2 [Chinchilla lanigera]